MTRPYRQLIGRLHTHVELAPRTAADDDGVLFTSENVSRSHGTAVPTVTTNLALSGRCLLRVVLVSFTNTLNGVTVNPRTSQKVSEFR